MATRTCPSCGEEVPSAASRCKHCFHDFSEASPNKKGGPTIFLGFVALMALVGLSVFWWIYKFRTTENVVVDAETSSIVITHKSAERTTTERVPFSDVQKIEHVMGGKHSMFEIVAVTTSGERYIIQASDDKPLSGAAEHIAAVIHKPMVEVRNLRTFGD